MSETRQKAENDKLMQARIYEQEKWKQSNPEMRPVFHVTPPVGWMNDPNGFSLYQGEYHLFSSTIPTVRSGVPCIGGTAKQRILSDGNSFHARWRRTGTMTGRAVFPALRWSRTGNIS